MRKLGVFAAALALAPAAHAGSLVAPAVPSARSLATPDPTAYTLVQLNGSGGAARLRAAGGELVTASPAVWRLPAVAASRVLPGLARHGLLLAAGPDRLLRSDAQALITDPYYADEWWVTAVGAERVQAPGPGVPVTIVDSGLDMSHPEFAGRPSTRVLNTQSVNGGEELHGTAVASVIGAPINGIGVVGIYPRAAIRSWDASPQGDLTEGDELRGIAATVRLGRSVINLSLGSDQRDFFEQQGVLAAFASGSLVVAAAGNSRRSGSPLSFPANLPHVLTVAATDENDAVTSFSSASNGIDLAAPGQDIPVAVPLSFSSSGYALVDGTSFSAPLVSGAAAWVWTRRPGLGVTQLFDLMRYTARDVGPKGFDRDTGFGVLDLPSALGAPAPAVDPEEPNDDTYLIRPGGIFRGGTRPLLSASKRTATLKARLDRSEDPADVYRVWVPARSKLNVFVTGDRDVDLRLWGPETRTIAEVGAARRRDVVATSAKAGSGHEALAVANLGTRGVWDYAAVTIGRRAGDARYSLSATTARR